MPEFVDRDRTCFAPSLFSETAAVTVFQKPKGLDPNLVCIRRMFNHAEFPLAPAQVVSNVLV